MNVELTSIYSWSIGSYAKAKYFTAKEQNKDDVYFALCEIDCSNRDKVVASFSADVICKNKPTLSGLYHIKLYFNSSGDTFYEIRLDTNYLKKLRNKHYEKYRASIQSLFEAIVATREFKWFAQKATNNIQDCFKEVIEPLYKGELKVSDELDINKHKKIKVTEEDIRKAIKNLMKLKTRLVSSSTLNLSHPELENT